MIKFATPLALVACIAVPATALGTTITADDNSFWYAPSGTKAGSATWSWSNPGMSDTITWTSGTNYADTKPFTHTPLTEGKFRFVYNPATGSYTITPATFVGFSYSDGPGKAGSFANTSGSGSSTVGPKSDVATWTVSASGTLGTTPPPLPSYYSTASGKDPITVNASDLASLTGSYNLFFVAGLTAANVSATGSAQFDVSYTTTAGTSDLLDIDLSPAGVLVTNAPPAGLSIFAAPSVDADPTTFNPTTALGLSDIENELQSDLSGGGLSNPEYFAFFLNDLPIPTTEISPGVLADIDVDITANDAAVPEPSGLFPLSVGLLGLTSAIWWRRKRT